MMGKPTLSKQEKKKPETFQKKHGQKEEVGDAHTVKHTHAKTTKEGKKGQPGGQEDMSHKPGEGRG